MGKDTVWFGRAATLSEELTISFIMQNYGKLCNTRKNVEVSGFQVSQMKSRP